MQRERLEYTENPRFPGIRFEPGDHGSTEDQYNKLSLLEKGELQWSIWNSEVLERVKTYQPQIIVIDGLTALLNHRQLSPDDNALRAKISWLYLPGRPSQINQKNEVLIVQGDPVRIQIALDDVSNSGKAKSKIEENDLKDRSIAPIEEISESIASGGIGFLLLMAIRYADFLDSKIKYPSHTHKLDRRDVLRIFAYGLVGSLFAYGYAMGATPAIISRSTDTRTKQIWQAIIDVVKPRFIKSNWIRYRLATLISKLEDTIEFQGYRNDIPATLLMGQTHTRDATDIIHNLDLRTSLTRNYAQKLMNILDQVHRVDPTFDLRLAKDYLLEYIATVSLTRMTDPLTESPDPAFVQSITKFHQYLGNFQSKQVTEALQGL